MVVVMVLKPPGANWTHLWLVMSALKRRRICRLSPAILWQTGPPHRNLCWLAA